MVGDTESVYERSSGMARQVFDAQWMVECGRAVFGSVLEALGVVGDRGRYCDVEAGEELDSQVSPLALISSHR